MGRRADYEHWSTGLPENSDALADLDDFCTEMGGIDRAVATRFILIAWSKSRRGEFGQMWGFASNGALSPVQVQASVQQQTPEGKPAPGRGTPAKTNTRKAAATAAAASLDLDD